MIRTVLIAFFLTTSLHAQPFVRSATASWIALEATMKYLARGAPCLTPTASNIAATRAIYANKASEAPKASWFAAKASRYAWDSIRRDSGSALSLYNQAYYAVYNVLKKEEAIHSLLEESFETVKKH